MDGPLPSNVKKEGDFVKFVPFSSVSEYKNDYDCFEITGPNQINNCSSGPGLYSGFARSSQLCRPNCGFCT